MTSNSAILDKEKAEGILSLFDGALRVYYEFWREPVVRSNGSIESSRFFGVSTEQIQRRVDSLKRDRIEPLLALVSKDSEAGLEAISFIRTQIADELDELPLLYCMSGVMEYTTFGEESLNNNVPWQEYGKVLKKVRACLDIFLEHYVRGEPIDPKTDPMWTCRDGLEPKLA